MIAGLILSGVLGAAASQLPPSAAVGVVPPGPTISSPVTSTVPEKPEPAFSRLFQAGSQPEVKRQPQLQPPPQLRTRPRSKVVCGMTLILVGPEGDPNMPKQPPNDGGITYTMRRYPPPACGQDEKERPEDKKKER